VEEASSLRMEQPEDHSTLDVLTEWILVEVPVDLDHELRLVLAQIDLKVRCELQAWLSSVNFLGCDVLDSGLEVVWDAAVVDLEESLGRMEVHVILFDVLQDDLVIVVDLVSLLLVFESSKCLEVHSLRAMARQLNLVAGVVLVRTDLRSFNERTRVDMHQLDEVSVLNKLS